MTPPDPTHPRRVLALERLARAAQDYADCLRLPHGTPDREEYVRVARSELFKRLEELGGLLAEHLNEDARALMAHHERLAAASRQEARVAPNAAEVLELLAQAIEARRDRQKCGTSFDDLVEQLDPAYLRSLIRPARAPRWAMVAR